TDIHKILLIGSGPIVIGQACEFDYSGSQACRALRAEGYSVALVNPNPATIMTDPSMADAVYLQELTPASIREIVAKEKPDAVLPTMGGQTALNLAQKLHEQGYWEEQGIHVIGVDIDAIKITEDRQQFRDLMERIGLDQARSRVAKSLLEAKEIAQELGGTPIVIRPSYTMGGAGGGIVWTPDEFDRKVARGLELSPIHEVLIEECLFGWKEYELELLRDANDNVVIICSIENVDPMGVHTGDSVTVAPQQTLTDKQFQAMRDAALRAMRSIGTFAGGCNIQFAVNPADGRMIVIEINPRVSRSSALASKATGYPIAKVAARLAVGYTLDELPNEVTGTTSACFEPALDYVVTKVPRFNFDKFDGAEEELTTQMKAVGEVMAIGRTFQESLQKAWQSLEIGYAGLGADRDEPDRAIVRERLRRPYWDRLLHVRSAFRLGASVAEIADITKMDPWFLYQVQDLVALEDALADLTLAELERDLLLRVKQAGFSDAQIAYLLKDEVTDSDVREHRLGLGLKPTYRVVDTCAGEFEAETPYFYSTYDQGDNESVRSDRKKVVILGSGPNRIGQGIEFDYSCVHGVLGAREMGYEALMINCNPETVSTDFDIADKLYFEPVFWERVKDVLDHEQPEGVMVQLGGQTALKLARRLKEAGVKLFGTPFELMDLAENRGRFSGVLKELEIPFPPYGMARSVREAVTVAEEIGYPILIRPSYVLGGQGMRIAINKEEVAEYVEAVLRMFPDNDILLDRFLENATEIDCDAIADGDEVHVTGIMQHIEPAGVHSGDSTAVLPPYSLSEETQATIRQYVTEIARRLEVVGLINVQLAVQSDGEREVVYVIEANPRASRTVPFVAKATGVPIAGIAAKVMLGAKLKDFRERGELESQLTSGYALKEPVFSWEKFPEVSKELGPEMKSTGEAIAFVDALTDEHFTRPFEMRNLYLKR
ncbi:MAG: carbamoyl-phosphate synthase large subunit, partial [Bacteroidota bacterium]